ncbi:GrpB family protein [Kitasatospora sp. NPDC004272]
MPTDTPPAVLVLPYDPAWPLRAAELTAGLRAVLGPAAVRVEHIGSTAVPGMAAKPVYDVQIGVTDLAEAERDFDGPLAALGFRRSPHRHDHVPAGTDDDPGRWVKRLWLRRDPAAGPDCNLHVRLLGSPNERLALLFRDWFRAHPEAVPGYAAFKRTLAASVADLDTYADVKDPVVDLVVALAEPWATATGWAP